MQGTTLGMDKQIITIQAWPTCSIIDSETSSWIMSIFLYRNSGLDIHQTFQLTFRGEIVNLQSVDATAVSGTFYFGHQIWSAPFQVIVSLRLDIPKSFEFPLIQNFGVSSTFFSLIHEALGGF